MQFPQVFSPSGLFESDIQVVNKWKFDSPSGGGLPECTITFFLCASLVEFNLVFATCEGQTSMSSEGSGTDLGADVVAIWPINT